ncbi:hypothetical protein QBC45DRAFT_437427 [Copromyces sp. CBS 386.78]|nr:hypothetical protein QBC45DRAFT_437427 [Copromyces sp. CBS 386.78]
MAAGPRHQPPSQRELAATTESNHPASHQPATANRPSSLAPVPSMTRAANAELALISQPAGPRNLQLARPNSFQVPCCPTCGRQRAPASTPHVPSTAQPPSMTRQPQANVANVANGARPHPAARLRKAAGSLMHLAMLGGRPDIARAAAVFGRFAGNPTKAEFQHQMRGLKRILEYLKDTSDLSWEFAGDLRDLEGYWELEFERE